MINSATTGGAGFIAGITSGVYAIEALLHRAGANAIASAGASALSDIAHGRPVNKEKAALSGVIAGGVGLALDGVEA